MMRPTVPSSPTQSKRLTIYGPEPRPKTPSSSLALSIWSGSSAIIGNNGRRSRRAENAEDSERISLSDTAVAMRNRGTKLAQWKPIQRYSFAVLGLMLIGMGVLNLLSGRLHYRNYWGAPVFPPAILIETLFFICR